MKTLGPTSKTHGDCPFECPNENDPKKRYSLARDKNCDTCPRKLTRKEFERATERHILLKLGEKHQFKIETLETKMYQIIRLLDAPLETVSLKTSFLINVYNQEKARHLEQD